MGYSAEDFFDDVVKKCENLEDIFNTPADSRGPIKFMTCLLRLYGEGSVAQGIHKCLLEMGEYDRHALLLYSPDGLSVIGDLPPNSKLVLSGDPPC